MFVNENMGIVGADTASSLLFYLFSMGYEPYRDSDSIALIESKDQDKGDDDGTTNVIFTPDFDFANFTRIINRDFDFIPAWSIVQASLALSFYQDLSPYLIKRVLLNYLSLHLVGSLRVGIGFLCDHDQINLDFNRKYVPGERQEGI